MTSITPGKYLVEGFAAGITANTYMAEARARAMARAAAAAAEAELDINSPSKVGYRIGGFFGMGFVNSLIDYTDKSYDAGASVAKSAKEGLRNAVSKIGDFIENGIDSQPTIRPLLDLSDVTEGAGRLSALLSRNQAMKISAGMDVRVLVSFKMAVLHLPPETTTISHKITIRLRHCRELTFTVRRRISSRR